MTTVEAAGFTTTLPHDDDADLMTLHHNQRPHKAAEGAAR